MLPSLEGKAAVIGDERDGRKEGRLLFISVVHIVDNIMSIAVHQTARFSQMEASSVFYLLV